MQNISTTVVLSDPSPNLAHSSSVDDHQSTCFKKKTPDSMMPINANNIPGNEKK
jgi:hypothetical protein